MSEVERVISDMADRVIDRLIEPHRRRRDKYVRRRQRLICAQQSVMRFVINFTMKFWSDHYLETVMTESKNIGFL